MKDKTHSLADIDPVFAAAEAASNRRREYEALFDQLKQERNRFTQALIDAARPSVPLDTCDAEYAPLWAPLLHRAGMAIKEAELNALLEDDATEWMPMRMARRLLRLAQHGPQEAMNAATTVVNDKIHRNGVRNSLRELDGVFGRALRERHEEALRIAFPDDDANVILPLTTNNGG